MLDHSAHYTFNFPYNMVPNSEATTFYFDFDLLKERGKTLRLGDVVVLPHTHVTCNKYS